MVWMCIRQLHMVITHSYSFLGTTLPLPTNVDIVHITHEAKDTNEQVASKTQEEGE